MNLPRSNTTTVEPINTEETLLEIVISALQASWRIPAQAPDLPLSEEFNRAAVMDFFIEACPGGFVANVSFDVPAGQPNTIGTPDSQPLPTAREAFLAGAAILCEIVTGSSELPFFVNEDDLIVATYSATGKPLVMRRPVPTFDV